VKVAVRLATVEDASAFGRFEATLGYPVTEEQARVRIKHIHENTCGAVFVFTQPFLDAGTSSSRGCDPRERGPSQVRYDDTCGAVYVFFDSNLLKGWAHIHAVPLLASDGYAEIGGLAVADAFRRQGVGKALIEQCKEWTRRQGFTRLRVYSGMHRTEAHAFYKALGFDGSKAPAFTLQL
jgi:ribosomal protein S18 acetylase RimI-like enzyme